MVEKYSPMVQTMTSLLEVENLRVSYSARTGEVCPALSGVDFDLGYGEILGVLGESGSGKSTLAAALLRLLPAGGKIQQGSVLFQGKNLLEVSPQHLRKIRGGRIGLISQEPSSSLHPTLQVGQQVSDVLAAHEALDRRTLREKTSHILASVFPEDVERISRSYPHELSGGERQRVLIAHNPALLAGLADRVLVLYAGRIAEIGPAAEVLHSPQHPYTAALLRCLPSHFAEAQNTRKTRLHVILGEPPDLSLGGNGCQFEPRCAERMEVCKREEPSAAAVSEQHEVSCFKFAG